MVTNPFSVFSDLCNIYVTERMSSDHDPLIWIGSKLTARKEWKVKLVAFGIILKANCADA